MIIAKKNAIKFKDADGTMKDAGMLCKVGAFGEDYLRYCRRIELKSLNDFKTSNVVLDLDNCVTLQSLCSIMISGNNNSVDDINTTVESLTINCLKQITSMQRMLYCDNLSVDNMLKRVTLNVDTQKVSNLSDCFRNLKALEVIDGIPLNCTECLNLTHIFNNCVLLKEIRIVKSSVYKSLSTGYSPLLSPESIQSIIDGLADLTEQTAQTLTVHKDVEVRMSEEQKAQITSKNWTLATA